MRLFFITHTYSMQGAGGGEVFVFNFLREMSKRGHKIFVFTTGTRRSREKEKKLGIKVYNAPCFGHHALHKFEYLIFGWIQNKAVNFAKEFNAEIIHSQNDALPGLIGSKVKKKLKIPHVLAVEYLSDKNVSLNMKFVFALNKFLIPRLSYDKIVSWSKNVIDEFFIPWRIPREKIELITGAVDTDAYNNKADSSEFNKKYGKNLIVSAKPLHKTNTIGISYTISAMKYVVKDFPGYKFLIAGGGTHKKILDAQVKNLNLEKNVIFLGNVPIEKVPNLYSAAEIVVHSFAFKATTSVALMESMASGKAIVATDSGEVSNTVKGSALLTEPENPKSIADAIIKFIQDPILAEEYGKKAREVAVKNYSIKAVCDKFEKLYASLL